MVSGEFEALFCALREASFGPPRGLARALRSLPPGVTLPAPWLTWALFGLLDLRRRKVWAWAQLEAHLAPVRPRRPGASAFKGLKASGILPCLPGWTFELDGVTGVVANRTTGECVLIQLDVSPGVFRRPELSEHLRARRDHGLAGRRLSQLYPGCRALPLAYDELSDAGLLRGVDEHSFDLCDEARWLSGPVAEFRDYFEEGGHRLWMAAIVGDWPLAHDIAETLGDPRLSTFTRRRADGSRRAWLDRLRERAERSGLSDELLYALADAGAGDLPRYIRTALEGSDDGAGAALELIGDDPSYVHSVERLLRGTGGEDRYSHLRDRCAEYLLRSGHSTSRVIEDAEAVVGPPEGINPARRARGRRR